MCDGCAPMTHDLTPDWWPTVPGQGEEPVETKPEDVRATKPHEVSLRVVVHAEDARKAVEKMLFGYDGTGLEVLYVSAAERTEAPW